MQSNFRSIVFASVGFFLASSSHAFLPNAKMPACLNGPDEMRIDNARILKLKHTTKNAYLDRAFVQGTVTEEPSVKNGHDHFVISIGPGPADSLEIIYNKEFGAMPPMRLGASVIVCGDYITSTAQTGQYQPSPEGALIHWIHFNPGSRAGSAGHEHGFVMTGADLIGFDQAPLDDWSGRIVRTAEPTGGGTGTTTPSQPGNPNPPVVLPPRSRPSNPRPDTRRPPAPGRWQPCRSLQECSARNHS